jgi:hypothetical protein
MNRVREAVEHAGGRWISGMSTMFVRTARLSCVCRSPRLPRSP